MNIFRNFIITLLLVWVPAITSCDDGEVKEHSAEEVVGKIVKLDCKVEGINSWPDNYDIALAGFTSQSDYAVIMKYITQQPADGHLSMTLSNMPDSLATVELCAVNSLRQRVHTFASISSSEIAAATDTAFFNADRLNVGMFTAIQQMIFNTTCTGCHRNENPAAGLSLAENKSYATLLNSTSQKVPGQHFVIPYDADNSLLLKILDTDLSESWHYAHNREIDQKRSVKLQLIHNWINNGAKQ